MADRPSVSIQELKKKIEELKELSRVDGMDLSEEITRLQAKLEALRAPTIPKELDDWERVKLARHPKRPYTLDYLERIMDDYYELRGDRLYGDDQAMVTALARFAGRTVVAIGHQKGRTAEENRQRNFGMAHPEGYRKALRAMKLAERFGFPILTFIDTPGAYPGIGAEERHIGGALAQNIYEMFRLRVPLIVAIVGEGGSGGALGIGVGDRVVMLENAIYSVISPEGCAAILWRDRAKAPEAARALKLTAKHLYRLGVIDEIIAEPPGGAQTDPEAVAQSLRQALERHLDELEALPLEAMLEARRRKFQAMGVYDELAEVVEPPRSGSP
jgi:acetyl-CoA carboxylase carboxyl transferase subunit alpha